MVSLNSMLKHPFSKSVVNSTLFPKSVTTGALKLLDHILQWIVSHIILPKRGGYSRVDQPKVHLVYAIKNKMRINWPYNVASRIYNPKDSGRGTSLGYASFI